MELLTFLLSLFILLPLGIPIAIVLVLSAIALMFVMGNWDSMIISHAMVMGTNSFALMAIPFFMLAGEFMSRGGLSRRIVDFANIIVGRFKGGLGYAAILASIIFAGLSGSAVADAAALGAILVPLMVTDGYNASRATGLICSGAIIAPIIPPSVPMIVLGSAVGISISKMFMAGIAPGIILGIALMITWKFIVKKDGYDTVRHYSRAEIKKIAIESIPALIMPLMIIFGIRCGIFTPTEAGAFAVVYAFLVCFFWYKELKVRDLTEIMINAAKSTAVVMFIVGAATAVGWLITVAQIPNQFAAVFGSVMHHKLLLLLIINFFLLLLGMVMDLTPNLLIFGPVIFPVIQQAGIDPYFFAVLMILNLCIGLITPPVGTILYLGCSVGKISFGQIVKGVVPFLITELIVLMLYVFFPQIILTPLRFITG
ncbi:MAG: TRAP transporter large permease [Bacillota bacterium]|jgi:tripartite ATP-independent transporter DctM subunit